MNLSFQLRKRWDLIQDYINYFFLSFWCNMILCESFHKLHQQTSHPVIQLFSSIDNKIMYCNHNSDENHNTYFDLEFLLCGFIDKGSLTPSFFLSTATMLPTGMLSPKNFSIHQIIGKKWINLKRRKIMATEEMKIGKVGKGEGHKYL